MSRTRKPDRVQSVPGTSSGCLAYSLIGAATTNATVVKATPGVVYAIDAVNINATVRYLTLYDKATTPAETDTPVLRIALQGGATGPRSPITFPGGLQFSAGIAFRTVTEIADNGTTAPSASETLINIAYY